MSLSIGPHKLKNACFLAPMSGVTDAPFRKIAHQLGAGLVVSEMVASEQLVHQRRDVVRRAEAHGLSPYVIQLAGREAKWMAEGAKIAQGMGADIIDINMGCPAKRVTTGLSGSALMRDLDHALVLIDAVIDAVDLPITLKMRLGWDDKTQNAPQLAKRAEQAGIHLITVHGRTRCQFYKGQADWRAIRAVKQAVNIPVIANGDITSFNDVKTALSQSGADGVMIGRGSNGRPWFPAQVGQFIKTARHDPEPSLAEKLSLIKQHYHHSLSHYGVELGVKMARKHLAWYLEDLAGVEARTQKSALCRLTDPAQVIAALDIFFITLQVAQNA